MSTLSVIILNYRTAEQTISAVRSVMGANVPGGMQVTTVDNNSGDGSPKAILRACPDINLIELPENVGFAAGMNAGIAGARGDYILLLNSDVIADPESVEALVTHMSENPNVGLAAPLLVDGNGRPSRSALIRPTIWRLLIPRLAKIQYYQWYVRVVGDRPIEVEATEGAAVMVRRAALEQVGLLDEQFFFYHEIMDWCMRFRKAGYSVRVVPSSRMVHACGGSTSGLVKASRIELKRSEYQLLRKHLGRPVSALVTFRDVAAETFNALTYALASGVMLGRDARLRDKLAAHGAILRWLLNGMPARRDERYIRSFGRWD